MGYISLNQRLLNDEVIAVAFQFTVGCQVYQVGEFANDGVDATEVDEGNNGNQIVNNKGEIVSFAGNSLFWSNDYYRGNGFYNKNVIKQLKNDWNSKIIRIPMTADPDIHDSYIFDKKTNQTKLEIVVAAYCCI